MLRRMRLSTVCSWMLQTSKQCPRDIALANRSGGSHPGLLLQIEKAHRGGLFQFGAEGRNRTGTPLQARDFESRASTSSATPAIIWVQKVVAYSPFW